LTLVVNFTLMDRVNEPEQLLGTNTLAYFAAVSVTNHKKFNN